MQVERADAEAAHGCQRGVGHVLVRMVGHDPADRLCGAVVHGGQADFAEQGAGGRVGDGPGVAGVGAPRLGARHDVLIWVGKTVGAQRRSVVKKVVGAQPAQVVRARVDLDRVHSGASAVAAAAPVVVAPVLAPHRTAEHHHGGRQQEDEPGDVREQEQPDRDERGDRHEAGDDRPGPPARWAADDLLGRLGGDRSRSRSRSGRAGAELWVRRRQVDEQRAQLASGLGRGHPGAALAVLVDVQPAVAHVLAEHAQRGLALAVRDPQIGVLELTHNIDGTARARTPTVTSGLLSPDIQSLISSRTEPWVTASPGETAKPATVPALCAVTGFSIFIASSTTTSSPAATC